MIWLDGSSCGPEIRPNAPYYLRMLPMIHVMSGSYVTEADLARMLRFPARQGIPHCPTFLQLPDICDGRCCFRNSPLLLLHLFRLYTPLLSVQRHHHLRVPDLPRSSFAISRRSSEISTPIVSAPMAFARISAACPTGPSPITNTQSLPDTLALNNPW